jgi:hypothetical protein
MARMMSVSPRAVITVAVGVAVTAAVVAAASILPQTTTYDVWGALFIAPILVAISLPALARQSRREGDRRLFWLLLLALVLKLLGGIARDFVANEVYGGTADANRYHSDGVRISDRFQSGIFDAGLESLTKTDFISFFTGIVYTFTGASRLGGYLVYSWLGFWGLYFFYRAFTLAVPNGRRRSYAILVFFLPSLLYWPSGIGKEAWMVFALGIASFGAAKVLTGRMWQGLAIAGLGVWLAGIVRLHMAGMLALALAVAYLVRKPVGERSRRGMVARTLSLAAVATLTVIVVLQAEQSLQSSGIRTQRGLTSALQDVAERTSTGGSEFQPSVLRSPARAPLAALTVLFRPFPFEAENPQALAAAVETSFLLLLCVVRRRSILEAIRSFRRRPYVAFALAYTGLFILAYSSIANLGILSRQRVQLLPLFVVLLCLPLRRRRGPEEAPAAAASPEDRDSRDGFPGADRANGTVIRN